MEHGIVIIGGSVSGYNVIAGLKKGGYQGKITLINQQNYLPYDVSTLSKSWMLDQENLDPPLFKQADYYADVTLKLNTVITQINPEEKTILTQDNEEIPYDTLVLATGSVLRTLNVPGSDAAGIFYLRDFEKATKIKAWAKKIKELVIVGAGFIGLEMASTFSQWGLQVTVIEHADFPLGRILGEEASRYFMKMHEEHGVRFLTGEDLQSFIIDENGNVSAAVTATGKQIDCQMAVIGVGVTPNITLSHPDLKVERGYLVNEYGETTLPDVYAVGDCVVWPYQSQLIHVEHWEHAHDHGKAVARNILNPQSSPYTVRPYFWTDQYDQHFEYLGHALTWDRIITRGSLSDCQFTLAYVDENNLPIAIFFANNGDKRKDVAKFMDTNQPIEEEKFIDMNNKLNEI
ncbi:NAD(P)/FAD-dependent oxidoreductase [Jeotgalibaca sp. A127]|uniref:NAD(P)/FAD-dependent oxidoreductase n=1 Tax=Jeotgalibaca sp. A127 TaxID=3457324 RepID=UPI003FD0B7CC